MWLGSALRAEGATAVLAALSFAAAVLLILLAEPLARRVGFVDRPGGRKRHLRPTPPVGGLVLVLVALPLGAAAGPFDPAILGLAAGMGIVTAIGVTDDVTDLRWAWRLVAQTIAATVMVEFGGVRPERLAMAVGADAALGPLAAAAAVFLTVGLINAFNMADGSDGLAGLLGLSTLGMLLVAAAHAGNLGLAAELAAFLGALGAFLVFNLRLPWRPYARIFLGEAGAGVLGLAIAWVLLRSIEAPRHPLDPALVPFLAAPPVVDGLAVVVRRLRDGRSPFRGDRLHLHHRLIDGGVPQTGVAIGLSAASLLLGLAATLARQADAPPALLWAAFVLLCVGHLGCPSWPALAGRGWAVLHARSWDWRAVPGAPSGPQPLEDFT